MGVVGSIMTENPYMRRASKHAIGKAGRASEKRLAKSLGGRARPASGAMQGAKGDIDLGAVLLEAKSTIGDSIGLKFEWLAKIGKEARAEGKTPALSVSFVRPDGTAYLDGEWVLVPLYKFKELF